MPEKTHEIIALEALSWLIANDELRSVFMGSTGLDADTLRRGASDSDLLSAAFDFIAMDDAWVIAFCQSADLHHTQFMAARAAMPGGDQRHWT